MISENIIEFGVLPGSISFLNSNAFLEVIIAILIMFGLSLFINRRSK